MRLLEIDFVFPIITITLYSDRLIPPLLRRRLVCLLTPKILGIPRNHAFWGSVSSYKGKMVRWESVLGEKQVSDEIEKRIDNGGDRSSTAKDGKNEEQEDKCAVAIHD